VRSAVETGKGPIRVDEADDEGDPALGPAGVIYECCENKFGGLVGGCLGGDNDEDEEEGGEGDVEGCGCDLGEESPVAVEEESEEVDDLVADEAVPWFDYAGEC